MSTQRLPSRPHSSRSNTTIRESAASLASHRPHNTASDPLPGPSSTLLTIHPKHLSALPQLVHDLSEILDEDFPSRSKHDTPVPQATPAMHSSPVTLSQLMAALPHRRRRSNRKPLTSEPVVDDDQDDEDEPNSVADADHKRNGHKHKYLQSSRKHKARDETSHLVGEEREVGRIMCLLLSHIS